ncbi:ribosome-associated translation inhibitor RaiA [Rhodovulum iodosum]|uniref:Ribosome-associated translation inhibitor RaiA n=1 Tax=Rhodovulum iodosum TaxID=68291 RepID=A0ABV3XTZ3_9RHOB|nr:HPF/RaiA family ribosome-associated protein [Rhodovulum robiginosum]RSK32234.1 HPF/RaiA family ribosome-associated protein [Rhodovulum robiginosum]
MQVPLELSFTGIDTSDSIKALVQEKVDHLETLFDRITSCHVYIRAPHRSQRQGNLYEITVEVRVPGDELVVHHRQNDAAAHQHLPVAVRHAFAAMEREVKRWKDKAGGDVKVHDGPLQGRIVEIRHDEGFGRIAANDGRLVYFHRNSVVDGRFEDLAPRDTVDLVVQSEESEIGPQASTVRPVGALKYDPEAR